ncbi:MAG TPA: VWA domain-containing protein [Candidatus Binatia bacterium]|nr:VWA domain-containing protein [Candidatus Binatia bacterium]
MTTLLADVQFAKPLLLWLLIGLPILWFWFADRRWFVLIWRTLILVVLIIALADPQFVTQQTTRESEERIFAFDVSKSISASMRQWMDTSAQGALAPNGADRTLIFAGEAKDSAKWRESIKAGVSMQDSVKPENTNLQQLFESLLSLPPAPRSVYLFTDGWENHGKLELMLPAIAASGLKVYPIVPAQRMSLANVTLARLIAPTHGDAGQAVNIKVVLENHNGREVDGRLLLTRNGVTFKTDQVKLKPGSQIISYQSTLADGPLNSYRASFTARQDEFDQFEPDNHALAWTSVRSKGKILIVSGRIEGGRYIEEILRRQGFEVTSRAADSAPAPTGFNVVIFNNVEREKLTASYLSAIERHVNGGNGFVMLGSEWSFGPGGYRRTPIETLLPVEFKDPPKQEEKNRAILLVIDKSGSMREDNRIWYAQEAAKAVARQLKDTDLLGVIGFDVDPFVVVPLARIGSLRGTFNTQIERLKPAGRTVMLPAIIEAKRQLERQDAGRKHVIILSDGETGGSGGDFIDLVNVMKTEQQITVSAVAIGAEANIPLLKRITQYGGGFFHHIYDPTTLPQIVLQRVQEKPKDEPPPPDRDFIPFQERGSELLAGFSGKGYPPLRGFIETELKRGAQLDLSIVKEGRKAPLLASWHYGRGRTVALTTDLEGRWSRAWIQWGSLPDFWEKVLEWIRPASDTPIPVHEARISLSGIQPILDLYIFEETASESQFRFAANGNGAKTEGILQKIAAGHFQSTLPILPPGEYRIDLVEERKGRVITYPPVGFTATYDPKRELPRPDVNLTLLTRLAEISGGEVNPKSIEKVERQHTTATHQPIRAPLMAVAFALFILEIAVRRLFLGES